MEYVLLNIPWPPLHIPAPVVSATGVVPQVVLSGPALAAVGVFTVTVIISVAFGQGASPVTVQVSVTTVPTSAVAGL